MITNILVAIISLGIWGKASKESQEKTRKASWLRTALYFVLSVIVGIVFYKTYQVSINENNVAVYKIFGTVNEQGENCDTAQIHITHRFNKDQYKDSLEYEDYVTHGGVQVNVISRPWGPKKVNMKYLPDTFEWLEMLDAWNVIPSTNAMTKVLERMHDAYDTNPELADVLYRYKSGMPLTSKEIDMLKLKIDYILLGTFVCFFVFVGNIARIEAVSGFFSHILTGREIVIAALLSQLISNVPAAVMLAEFTDKGTSLLLGVDIGGFGTIIASMASLIAFQIYKGSEDARAGRYMTIFTAVNVFMFLLLLGFQLIIMRV